MLLLGLATSKRLCFYVHDSALSALVVAVADEREAARGLLSFLATVVKLLKDT